MHLQESGEMYLETILRLSYEKPAVRSIDICDYMGYSKPSVSRAMGLLKNGGFVLMDKDGYITLTEDGRYVAEKIYERHRVISDFLMRIGVSEKTATEDACRFEHTISDETFDALKRYMHKREEELAQEQKE